MTVSKKIYDALIPVEKAKPDLPEEWEEGNAPGFFYRFSAEVLGYNDLSGEFDICSYVETKLDEDEPYGYFTDKPDELIHITHWMPLYEKE